MNKTLAIILISTLISLSSAWQNDYDGPLYFLCPSGQFINDIASEHNNHDEDRIWDFTCLEDSRITDFCFWSGYVNDYDEPIDFECPHQDNTLFVIAGMSSIHDDHYEDRIWDYYCCELESCDADCVLGPYVNNYDDAFNYTLADGSFLNGVKSEHDNHYEDRRWQYNTCTCSNDE